MPFWKRPARYMPMAAGTSHITVSRYIAVSSGGTTADWGGRVSDVRAITRMRLCGEWKLAIEAISQAAHVAQVARLCRVVPDLAPQVGDVIIHDARGRESVLAPGRGDQLIAAQHAAACANEGIQQFELDRCKFHGAASQAQFAAREIHPHLAEAAALRIRFPGGAAQQGFDAGAQFTCTE